MNQYSIQMNIFLILLLQINNAAGMIPSTPMIAKKQNKGTFLKEILLLERLNYTSKLLLKDKPFDFSERLLPEDKLCYFSSLSAEIDTKIITLLIPDNIHYISQTCKVLNEKLSFKKPYIWNVLQHNLNYIPNDTMPHLLALALSYDKKEIQDQIYSIKHENRFNKICSTCNAQRFCPVSTQKIPAIILAHLLEKADCHTTVIFPIQPLKLACYTGDIGLVTDILKKNYNEKNKNHENIKAEISESMGVAIERNLGHIIPLLYKSSKIIFNTFEFFWYSSCWFEYAKKYNTIEAFEALVKCSKNDFINEQNGHRNTYLDRLLEERADQIFIDIVKENGGQTAEEQRSLLEKCSIQ